MRAFLFLVGGVLLATSVAAQDYLAELKRLQPRIDRTIDAGVRWLVDQQLPDGSWGGVHGRLFPSGETALATYTLLKCGLPRSHRSVAAGLEWLKTHEPRKTYSIACQMLAYEATRDPAYVPRIEALLKELLRAQEKNGGFNYPGAPADRPDLSNTQYGALGLRAAMLAGVRIPRSALQRMVQFALDHQGRDRQVKLPADPVMEAGRTGKGKDGYDRTPGEKERTGYAAGFHYTRSHPHETGSMTTAGMGILLIGRDCYGKKLPRVLGRRIRRAVERGLNWMRLNWDVNANPRSGAPPGGPPGGMGGAPRGGAWHLYYLYGLERVGSLLLQEVIAGHPWYLEGARVLVRDQTPGGSWGAASGQVAGTCFALLFLERATWVGRGVTGPGRDGADVPIAGFHSGAGDVRIKGRGGPEVTLWVDGFKREILERWRAGRRQADLRVLRVGWRVDGEEVAVIQGDPARTWRNETFAAKHSFEKPGTFSVVARVELLPPGVRRHDADTKTITLESDAMSVRVTAPADTWRSWMKDALEKNVLPRARTRVDASSSFGARTPPELAIDGREATSWLCEAADRAAFLRLRLGAPRRVRHVMLSQNLKVYRRFMDRPAPGPGARAVTRVALHVNGSRKPTVEAALGPDHPTRITLPEEVKLKSLRIVILERDGSGPCGLSEVYVW